ncbi:MAG TPA: hypothetical protein VH518_00410 [Tepidisphaeraceae bacterium]|jgi:hypothetical protein
MSENQQDKPPKSDRWSEVEKEIRKDRSFSLEEAIGRLAGPGAMKGASPVTRKQQAEASIEEWLNDHLTDCAGALRIVVLRNVSRSDLLLNNYDQPLIVLAAYCQQILKSDFLLKELVCDTDTEWGRVCLEQPHFNVDGQAPDADDPYTVESVRHGLGDLIKDLAAGCAGQ